MLTRKSAPSRTDWRTKSGKTDSKQMRRAKRDESGPAVNRVRLRPRANSAGARSPVSADQSMLRTSGRRSRRGVRSPKGTRCILAYAGTSSRPGENRKAALRGSPVAGSVPGAPVRIGASRAAARSCIRRRQSARRSRLQGRAVSGQTISPGASARRLRESREAKLASSPPGRHFSRPRLFCTTATRRPVPSAGPRTKTPCRAARAGTAAAAITARARFRPPEARARASRAPARAAAKETPKTPVCSAYWTTAGHGAWLWPSSSQGKPSSPTDCRYSIAVHRTGAASSARGPWRRHRLACPMAKSPVKTAR